MVFYIAGARCAPEQSVAGKVQRVRTVLCAVKPICEAVNKFREYVAFIQVHVRGPSSVVFFFLWRHVETLPQGREGLQLRLVRRRAAAPVKIRRRPGRGQQRLFAAL